MPIPKKTRIILIIFIIIIIIIILITRLKSDSPLSPAPSLSPSPVILQEGDANIIEEQKQSTNNYPLLDFLPYQTADYAITYLGPLYLKITLWGADKNIASQSAINWIKEKGIDPGTHQIIWN